MTRSSTSFRTRNTRFVNLGIVTGLLSIGASIFTRIRRKWVVQNTTLEQRLAARTAELAAANAYIEQRASARIEEVAQVEHDLRHFLTLIHAAVESIMLDAADAGIEAEALQYNEARARDGLQGIQSLLKDALDAAKLEAHMLELQPQSIDFSALVMQVADQLGSRLEAAECALTTNVADNLPPVRCDPQRMARVLQNVIGDAISNTSADGSAVEIQLSHEGAMLVCRITDNGPGIAPEELARLRARFARVAAGANVPEMPGVGVTFTIGIMHLTGGTFALESGGVGMGTTAVLRLPIASPAPVRIAPRVPIAPLRAPHQHSRV
jgi:signal transduction histidine kinase